MPATRMRASCWSPPRPASRWRPEGGQHQSINTPLIGMAADRLASFEPAHVDELAILLRHAFAFHAAAGRLGGLAAPVHPPARPARAQARSDRGDRRRALGRSRPRRARASPSPTRAPIAPEAEAAFAELRAEDPGAGLLAITSPDRLHAGWLDAKRARRQGDRNARAHIETHPRRRWLPRRRWSPCWTGIRRRIPGSARSAASAWCRSVRTISARAATCPTSIANTVSIPTRSWMPARRPCSEPDLSPFRHPFPSVPLPGRRGRATGWRHGRVR